MNLNYEQERQAFHEEFKGKTLKELYKEKEAIQDYIQEIVDARDRTKPLKNEEYLRAAGRSDPRRVEYILGIQRAAILQREEHIPEEKRRLAYLDEKIQKKENNINNDRGLSL